MIAKQTLARKYAQAFLLTWKHTLQDSDIASITSLARYLDNHKEIIFYLGLSAMPFAVKHRALDTLLSQENAPGSLRSLMDLLISHGRMTLLSCVLHTLVSLYYQRKGTLSFTLTSSHALSKQELGRAAQFLTRYTHKNIVFQHSIDKNLIAGIRAQSATFLWEYSVRKQLQNINLSLIR